MVAWRRACFTPARRSEESALFLLRSRGNFLRAATLAIERLLFGDTLIGRRVEGDRARLRRLIRSVFHCRIMQCRLHSFQ